MLALGGFLHLAEHEFVCYDSAWNIRSKICIIELLKGESDEHT